MYRCRVPFGGCGPRYRAPLSVVLCSVWPLSGGEVEEVDGLSRTRLGWYQWSIVVAVLLCTTSGSMSRRRNVFGIDLASIVVAALFSGRLSALTVGGSTVSVGC